MYFCLLVAVYVYSLVAGWWGLHACGIARAGEWVLRFIYIHTEADFEISALRAHGLVKHSHALIGLISRADSVQHVPAQLVYVEPLHGETREAGGRSGWV